MLPTEIMNDSTKREWRLLPPNELDIRNVTELWRRKEHPDDTFPTEENPDLALCFHGEWVNCTERAKLEWEIVLAENEELRLRRQSIQELREQEDLPIARGVKKILNERA